MIKTADEILIKYAAMIDELPVPAPKPPDPKKLELAEPEDIEIEEPITSPLPTPIPIPETKPLSQRDKEEAPEKEYEPASEPGTPEWQAYHYPVDFVRGVYVPWDRYYVEDPTNREALVEKAMKKILRYNPGDYFKSRLYKKNELRPWIIPAAKALIKKDPMDALQKEIWRYGELGSVLGELWNAVFEKAIKHSTETPGSTGQILSGILRRKIRSLAGVIAETDPDFYMTFIKGKSTDKETGLTTKEFDEKAERVYKLQKERGLIKEDELPPTKI